MTHILVFIRTQQKTKFIDNSIVDKYICWCLSFTEYRISKRIKVSIKLQTDSHQKYDFSTTCEVFLFIFIYWLNFSTVADCRASNQTKISGMIFI